MFSQVPTGDHQVVRVHCVPPHLVGVCLHLFQRVAQQLGPARVDQRVVGLVVPFPGTGACAGDDVVQPLAFHIQHLLRPFVGRDIAADGDVALYPVVAKVGRDDRVHPIE